MAARGVCSRLRTGRASASLPGTPQFPCGHSVAPAMSSEASFPRLPLPRCHVAGRGVCAARAACVYLSIHLPDA